ncbi:unnamed protein product [Adineta steineri]|uniref:Uncharacterized protein n=1 Tax=Adineta steineri TaxID=433720 RepID=A0A814DMX6_9BILA|nr:unnamed protein product [Adineta steineri]
MMNKKSTTNFHKSLFSVQSSSSSMVYLCRFRQRNRLIEIPITSEYYHQQNGISHEHLRQLIIQEFQLQQIIKTTLIIQIWNEQYQEYIDIESFKQIPFEGRLQVLISSSSSMVYLCRFRQRNRLIEIPITSEYYHQHNGISHEHLRQLIIQEFQLQQIIKTTLIIQIWNEQYQEYIDIESFKQIPFEGRLQVLM